MDTETVSEHSEQKPRHFSKRAIVFSRLKRRLLGRHVLVVRAFIVVLMVGIIFSLVFAARELSRGLGFDRYVQLAYTFIATPEGSIASTEGKTNILVLGKAGEGHTAPDLTDTMMLISVNHDDPAITMISLPRDIWIPELRAKLNSVYYWGNEKRPDGGLVLAKATVEEIMGVPVHFGTVIDFNGFVRLIDTLGGIEVDVERSFEDKHFPIPGRENDECDGDREYACRYETISFEKGMRHMDGETALKYVRSRHSEDLEEGTDIARGRRQQLVIRAIKDKLTSREVITSPKTLKAFGEAVFAMTETDMPEPALAVLMRRAFQAREETIARSIPEDLLENPPINNTYDNLYVFIPKGDSWEDVHSWVRENI